MIAWRYLRAKRAEGGVSVMTWISLIGIMLAVAALIITMSVRAGFRVEFVDTIVGANAHVTVRVYPTANENGVLDRSITDYIERADALRAVEGVTRVAPLVKGQVMANHQSNNTAALVFGITEDDLRAIPRVAEPINAWGDIANFNDGVAIGSGIAQSLGLVIGDMIKIISPNGVRTAFGVTPRVNTYEVTFIFSAGRYDIDNSRIYMPFAEAQSFFNREGAADELEVMTENPETVDDLVLPILRNAGERATIHTWRDVFSSFLRALDVEDTVMFVLMSVLVLIASLNIISGLVMLVKNKGRDIGILRTMGLTEGAVMRVFFICGALVGVIGTALGVVLGCLFAIYFDPILAFVNGAAGGGVWDPSVRGIYRLPAILQLQDVLAAVGLSLILSFGITLFPARRAARMNPVEALRYE
nr:lipoprotein-releasing ABC transporter permease subunit [Cochlodiniinecator piscidefendens]